MALPTQQELRRATPTSQVQRESYAKASAEYSAGAATQAQNISKEIAERQARINELERRKASSLWQRLDNRSKTRALKEIAQLRGEVEYLSEAQTITASGSQVNITDFDTSASQYARSTPEYQIAKYKLKKTISKLNTKAEVRRKEKEYENLLKITENQKGTAAQRTLFEKHGFIAPEYITIERLPALEPGFNTGEIVVPYQSPTLLQRTKEKIMNLKIINLSPPLSIVGISLVKSPELNFTVKDVVTGAGVVASNVVNTIKNDPGIQTGYSLIKYGVNKLDDVGYLPVTIKQEYVEDVKKGEFENITYIGEFAGKSWVSANVTGLFGNKRQELAGRAAELRKYEDYTYQLDYQKEFDKEAQARFDVFIKTPAAEGLTFEEAQETPEWKKIDEQLQKKYSIMREREIASSLSWGQKLLHGAYYTGLQTQSTLLTATESPKNLVISGAVVGGVGAGLAGLGSVAGSSTVVKTALQAVPYIGVAAGSYMTFNPRSSPEQAFKGAVILGLSLGTLGYRAIRYARQPFVKYKKIPFSKAELRAAERIGAARINEGRGIVRYGSQQVYQSQGIPGRRTIVTSRWSTWFSKQPYGSGAIYRGVPTANPKGYTKALGRLTSYGYSPVQAKQTLRYFAPKFINQRIVSQTLFMDKGKVIGKSVFEISQPKVTLSKRLGIKTRGARPLKQISYFERELRVSPKGTEYAQEWRYDFIETKTVPRDIRLETGATRNFKIRYSESKLLAKDSGLKKYTPSTIIDAGQTQKYSLRIKGESVNYREITSITNEKEFFPGRSRTIRVGDKTILFESTPQTPTTIKVFKPAAITKTPFSKTFGFQPTPRAPPVPLPGGGSEGTLETLSGGVGEAGEAGEYITITTLQTPLQIPITAPALVSTTTSFTSPILQKDLIFGAIGSESIIGASLFKIDSKSNLKTDLRNNLKVDTKVDTDFKQDFKQDEATGQKSFQLVEPVTIQIPALEPLAITTSPSPTPPSAQTTPTFFTPKLPELGVGLKKRKPSLMSEFKVFAKRFGKDKLIATTQTKEEAKTKLFGKLKSTLAASGYISKGGQKLKVSELGTLKFGFAPSKKDIFRVVEVKEKRLKKGTSETQEIKMFKKKGRKRNLFGI